VMLADTVLIIACLWKQCYGKLEQVVHGETYQRYLANGTRVFKRFNRWSAKGVFERIFNALSGDPDMEYAMMDAMIVPVHRYDHGTKGGLKIKLLAGQEVDGQPKF